MAEFATRGIGFGAGWRGFDSQNAWELLDGGCMDSRSARLNSVSGRIDAAAIAFSTNPFRTARQEFAPHANWRRRQIVRANKSKRSGDQRRNGPELV
ncbi:MAG: hypothetical protein JO166_09100 [Deltaproteobacteria bacterium]|nr:hypothetical protein [Deltaproteobacteria bacterium]